MQYLVVEAERDGNVGQQKDDEEEYGQGENAGHAISIEHGESRAAVVARPAGKPILLHAKPLNTQRQDWRTNRTTRSADAASPASSRGKTWYDNVAQLGFVRDPVAGNGNGKRVSARCAHTLVATAAGEDGATYRISRIQGTEGSLLGRP